MLPGATVPNTRAATSFGSLCLNNNTDAIIMANDICNRAGIDTISGGSIIAFAIELYENGILTQKDTEGIDLSWGNHQAMVAMTGKMCNREGIGDVLANGVKRAAESIGKGSEQFAMHIGGQEVAMHDPKVLGKGRLSSPAARYNMDATPGRHTMLFGPHSVFRYPFPQRDRIVSLRDVAGKRGINGRDFQSGHRLGLQLDRHAENRRKHRQHAARV